MSLPFLKPEYMLIQLYDPTYHTNRVVCEIDYPPEDELLIMTLLGFVKGPRGRSENFSDNGTRQLSIKTVEYWLAPSYSELYNYLHTHDTPYRT